MESRNPVFKGITEYLVEEAPAEEEELLGQDIVTDESKSRIAGAIKVFYYIYKSNVNVFIKYI